MLAGKDRAARRGGAGRAHQAGMGVVVLGINMAKRHQRPKSRTQQAGILTCRSRSIEQRAGRLPALRQATCTRTTARGRDEARPRLQALRRADGGGPASDEKPKVAAAEKPARQFRRAARGSRRRPRSAVPGCAAATSTRSLRPCAGVRLRQPDADPATREGGRQHRPGEAIQNAKALDAAGATDRSPARSRS